MDILGNSGAHSHIGLNFYPLFGTGPGWYRNGIGTESVCRSMWKHGAHFGKG